MARPVDAASTLDIRSPHRTPRRVLIAFYGVLIASTAVLAVALPDDRGAKVTNEDLGTSWPLMVPDGVLRCVADRAITFERDGTEYMLTHPTDHDAYADIARIRAQDVYGVPMDLTPLIEHGTRLCG